MCANVQRCSGRYIMISAIVGKAKALWQHSEQDQLEVLLCGSQVNAQGLLLVVTSNAGLSGSYQLPYLLQLRSWQGYALTCLCSVLHRGCRNQLLLKTAKPASSTVAQRAAIDGHAAPDFHLALEHHVIRGISEHAAQSLLVS